jgi:hypothetical protein
MQTTNGKQYGFCLKMIGYCHVVRSTVSFVALDLHVSLQQVITIVHVECDLWFPEA